MTIDKLSNREISSVIGVNDIRREVLFNLEPFFVADSFNLLDKTYFPKKCSDKQVLKNPIVKYYEMKNIYMDNEIKGFIRHKIIDDKCSPRTIREYMMMFVKPWTNFINEKYPNINSCLEKEYTTLYNDYMAWLSVNGYKHERVVEQAYITKDMEWKASTSTTAAVKGFKAYYKYIMDVVYVDNMPEYQKDIWDVRKLGVPVNISPANPKYTLNFQNISQNWLRKKTKKYMLHRIQYKAMTTVLNDMKAINVLSEFLLEYYPNINDLSAFDHKAAEKFVAYMRMKQKSSLTINKTISRVKMFFDNGNLLSIKGLPVKPVFLETDIAKIPQKIPIPFTNYELRQLNEHINELPIYYARMFFILENCGMRVGDLCESTILVGNQSCLQKYDDGYIFTYAQPKGHKINTVPVTELIADVIRSAIKDSQEKYGLKCKYIFARSIDQCVKSEDFVKAMNRLSLKNNMKTEVGEPLHIKGHTFRKTKATEYANMGISIDLIRIMLGHSTLNSLKHYITIHNVTMVDAMRNIIVEDNTRIKGIGTVNTTIPMERKELNEDNMMIPLPNGYCTKKISTGFCKDANACYTCRMYRPTKDFLPLYEAQLREAEANIAIAELHGFEGVRDINQNLREQLLKIIERVRVDE